MPLNLDEITLEVSSFYDPVAVGLHRRLTLQVKVAKYVAADLI